MKIYKNRATRYHPSIEIESNEEKWKNIELTHNPVKKKNYIELKNNPNPNSNKKSYARKYIRNDPIRTRGDLLKKFKLSKEDLKQIEDFIINRHKKS